MKQILTIFLLALPVLIYAQEPRLEVTVSRDTILMGNQVKITFTAVNTEGEFIEPELNGLKVANGPFTASSYTFANGQSSRQVSYTYYLSPEREGVVTVGKASIKSAEKELTTYEITLFVKDNPDNIRESPEGEQRSRGPEDIFGDMGDIFKNFPSIEDIFKGRGEKEKPKEDDSQNEYKFKTEKL